MEIKKNPLEITVSPNEQEFYEFIFNTFAAQNGDSKVNL